MTEREFLDVIRSVSVGAGGVEPPTALTIDLSPFDSLDLLYLRGALEQKLGRNLSGEKFRSASTLRDLYRLVCQ
jgi:acyl carrier protein